ncbi:hypothetical protein [Haloferula sp. A504]|uniref:hypothetical protein n=1 Tax=Haloferula sp. A504 TaxID=3373601 RepID=UPI0031C6F766|nr:hypothetical protein [Verrucomicrobiaceae bacterium E54]
MRNAFRILLAVGCLGLATSCYYGAYDYGYSSSYGFSNGGSTSFIYTNSDRWLYDSTIRCYYDRTRHCYYDPWVGGYYPRGYCPPVVVGVPHPYGWNGRGKCPPPRNVHSGYINRHSDRLGHLRSSNYDWARNVRHGGGAHNQNWRNNRIRAAENYHSRGGQRGQIVQNQQPRRGHQGQVVQNRPIPRTPGVQNRGWNDGNQFQNWNQRGGRQPEIRPGRQPVPPNSFGQGRGGNSWQNQNARPRPGFNQPVNVGRTPATRNQPPRTNAARQPSSNSDRGITRQQQASQFLRQQMQQLSRRR